MLRFSGLNGACHGIEQAVEIRAEQGDAHDGDECDQGDEQTVLDHRRAFFVSDHCYEVGNHSISYTFS
jgi:hypothetical protein